MMPFLQLGLLRGVLTPRGLLARGIVLGVIFAAVHLAGWREYTSVLCGTLPDSATAPQFAGYLGAAYVVCYLLAAVIAPILVLAAALLRTWERWRSYGLNSARMAP